MDPSSHEAVFARERQRILARIERANELIDDHENTLLLSESAKEKRRLRDSIVEAEQLLAKYRSQYDDLMQTWERFSHFDGRSNQPGDENREVPTNLPPKKERSSSSKPTTENLEDLEKRLEELRSEPDLEFSDLLVELPDSKLLLHSLDQEIVHEILQAIEQGQIPQAEVVPILELLQNVLELEEPKIKSDVPYDIFKIRDILHSDIDHQPKLEFCLPMVPKLLHHSLEPRLQNTTEWGKAWSNLRMQWKKLLLRMNKNLWSLELITYLGSLVASSGSAPPQSAKDSLETFMNQTAEGMIYLSNLQEGLEIDPHNEFEAMLEAPAHLSELYMAIQELERLVQGVADWSSRKHLHPSTDLSRISELLLSTIGMFESISNQMSWAESSTTTFEQLKRNLTALSTSMLRLTYWLRQMSYAAL